MDIRAMNATPLPSGMNMNNLTPHQKQQLLAMQQQRLNGAGMDQGMGGMSPQQLMYQQQEQERMRQAQQQQQRMMAAQQQQQQAGSPTHMGSPMVPNDNFPALRSNSTIPGIARIGRSPSDGSQGSMTPRMPSRGPSMGQEDYQRAMLQRQQQQMQAASWQQQQHQQQQMQMQAAASSYGMQQRPGSATHAPSPYGGAPSPPNSSQNWSTPGGSNSYPFAQSPGSSSDHVGRHMSATPVPQQMQQNHTSPPTDHGQVEFDPFSWPQ